MLEGRGSVSHNCRGRAKDEEVHVSASEQLPERALNWSRKRASVSESTFPIFLRLKRIYSGSLTMPEETSDRSALVGRWSRGREIQVDSTQRGIERESQPEAEPRGLTRGQKAEGESPELARVEGPEATHRHHLLR